MNRQSTYSICFLWTFSCLILWANQVAWSTKTPKIGDTEITGGSEDLGIPYWVQRATEELALGNLIEVDRAVSEIRKIAENADISLLPEISNAARQQYINGYTSHAIQLLEDADRIFPLDYQHEQVLQGLYYLRSYDLQDTTRALARTLARKESNINTVLLSRIGRLTQQLKSFLDSRRGEVPSFPDELNFVDQICLTFPSDCLVINRELIKTQILVDLLRPSFLDDYRTAIQEYIDGESVRVIDFCKKWNENENVWNELFRSASDDAVKNWSYQDCLKEVERLNAYGLVQEASRICEITSSVNHN